MHRNIILVVGQKSSQFMWKLITVLTGVDSVEYLFIYHYVLSLLYCCIRGESLFTVVYVLNFMLQNGGATPWSLDNGNHIRESDKWWRHTADMNVVCRFDQICVG